MEKTETTEMEKGQRKRNIRKKIQRGGHKQKR
jgi:hypothetical protein